jgi:hypothetical protein
MLANSPALPSPNGRHSPAAPATRARTRPTGTAAVATAMASVLNASNTDPSGTDT